MDTVHIATIICPDCGAELAPASETCEQCGATTSKPRSSESKEKLRQLLDRPWVIVVLILHVGLLGIPLYWRTNYSLGTRLAMVIASIVYTVGAVAFIVMMVRRLIYMVFGG
ncbi:MAG: hypothetical protein O3C40_34665 [Planctomycetota bacterium]|nr:hypothetical protein [Planctomycetota bacterium]